MSRSICCFFVVPKVIYRYTAFRRSHLSFKRRDLNSDIDVTRLFKMNLWRKSKSWFQDSFPSQKENFEPQDYLEQEKHLLKAKYEQERAIIEKQFHYEMLEAKLRFENELRRLEDEHSRLKAKNKLEIEAKCLENGSESPAKDGKRVGNDLSQNSPAKNAVESGLDALEWDPVNELKSYTDNDVDSWEIQTEISHDDESQFGQEEEKSFESRDSAYGSISTELQRKSVTDSEVVSSMKKFKTSDVERKVDQLRTRIRQEIAREFEEKFLAERKFLYTVIDELEENVALLRKQKEDIVTIFEAQEKVVDEKH